MSEVSTGTRCRVFYASTFVAAMTLAAALDAGLCGPRDERRLLIVADTSAIPEVTTPLHELPAFAALRDRFDEIANWNEIIAPLHPAHWSPDAATEPMLGRLVTETLGLQAGVDELVLESITDAPARTIGSLIGDCPVSVYSHRLSGYGPTPDSVAQAIGDRVQRLLYLDLVTDVSPLLLREYDAAHVLVPDDAFRGVMTDVLDALGIAGPGEGSGAPVILGQDLAGPGVLDAVEEAALYERMLVALAAGGAARVIFRPHPSRPHTSRAHTAASHDGAGDLHGVAERLGVALDVADDGLPAEVWCAANRPSLVVSCCSSALTTVARSTDCPVATMGTDTVLARVSPFGNPIRMAATIADAVLPRLQADGSVTPPPHHRAPDELVGAVGYCMQPSRVGDLREAAEHYVAGLPDERYVPRRRLESLGLVARTGRSAVRSSPVAVSVRSAGRRALAVARRPTRRA